MMNATISGIIDVMFKDTVMNAETAALHEELLHNCQEHYDDLINQGLSETEAIDAVVESLKGMKEVIDEYPKKPGRGNTAEEQDAPVAESTAVESEPAEKGETDRVFSSAGIRKIFSSLRGNDITVTASPDSSIHVLCENPEQIQCEVSGGCLSIRTVAADRKAEYSAEMKKPEEFSLKGIMGFIGKMINQAAVHISENYSDVRIELPGDDVRELDINTMSGDITVQRIAETLNLHSTSGDIRIENEASGKAGALSARTTSGDIHVRCNADQAELSSISGDLTMRGDCVNTRIKSTSGDTEFEGCAQEINVSSISGDHFVRIGNADIRLIKANSTSGEIEIHLPDQIRGVSAAMKSVSGSTRCRFADSGENASLRIQASSVSGNINIQ